MISVEHLTKRYGDCLAVDDLSFEIGEGHVYGFLGPNGAGKSTTMNIMAGCLSATAGRVRIDGHDIFDEPRQAKKCIGYLPEQPPLYPNESPEEYLRFVGEAKGLRGAALAQQMDEVIEKTRIGGVRHKRIAALSKGYKQRVGIAQALLGNPKTVILDEPTVGLDPIQIIEIRDLIEALGREHTVIFSSHILSEVQTVCDRILMIARGKLAAFDTPAQLQKQLFCAHEITLTTDASEQEARSILGGLPHLTALRIQPADAGLLTVQVKTDSDAVYDFSRAVFGRFARSGRALLEMNVQKGSLEDVFLELSEAGEAEEARAVGEGGEAGASEEVREAGAVDEAPQQNEAEGLQ